jgi:hypothetical protein
MEKRKVENDVNELKENTVKLDDMNTFKNTFEKDIKLAKNRLLGQEMELRKTDNYIDKKLPIQIVKIAAEMIDSVLTKKKEKELLKT